MARVRSPNYPQLGLRDAVERVARVFEKEHQHLASKDVIVKHLGYSSVNGASLSALSALHKYGLLDKEGKEYKVSDLAIEILHPSSDAEKAEALQKAALSPALFAEIIDHYKGPLPSDDNLRAYLIRRGFAQSAISNVIKSLRDTIELVGVSGDEYTPEEQSDGVDKPVQSPAREPQRLPQQPRPMPGKKDFRVMLTEEGLQVSADLSDQKGVDRLIAILNANKELLPSAADTAKAEGTAGTESDQSSSDNAE